MININIKSTKFNMTPDIKDLIQEKINLVEKFINLKEQEEVFADVEIFRSSHHKKGEIFKCEINLRFKGRVFRVVSKDYDIRIAIEDARSELEKQIRRGKGKRFDVFKKGARKLKELIRRENNE